MIPWVRIGIALAIAAAVAAGVATLRAHWLAEGEQRVQSKWDAQTYADAQQALLQQQEARRFEAARARNAEEIANEQHRRETARTNQLAGLQRTADGLRDAIDKLDVDDLSAAAADPRVASIAQRAIAARGLLGQCAERYRALAGRAAAIRDQAVGLQSFALNVCHAGVDQTGASQ